MPAVGYPTKLLNANEKVVLDLHPHWRIFLAPGAVVVAALALFILLAWVLDLEGLLVGLSAIPFVFGILWFIYRLIIWRTTYFVVTTDRVIYRSGVVSKSGRNIPLEGITNIASSQTVLERMLGVGDLQIESAGVTGRQRFSDILNPTRVENRIYAEIENAKERDDVRAARAGISVGEELTKLEDLRARGVITAEEFEVQKRRLLDTP